MKKIYDPKKINMLKSIPEEEKMKLLETAPEEVKTASEHLKDAWILMELSERALSENVNRFFTFKGKEDDITIDLASTQWKGLIKRGGGSIEDLRDAEEIRKEIILPLISKIRTDKLTYNYIYREEKPNNFTPELSKRLIDLYSEMNDTDNIQKILKEEGITISNKELVRFFSKNKAEIDTRKSLFLTSSKEYKVATDAGRLSILNNILTDLHIKYIKYQEQGRDDKALIYVREIRNVLEQARKEVKGTELKLTVDGKIDIHATLHGQSNVDRTMRTLPINALVVGLVAAKSGMEPTILINQLATSYYKDLNGFNKNILGREAIMLPGDLIRGMDWNEVGQMNKKFLNEMQPVKIEEAIYEEVEIKESLKDRLRRLRAQQE